MGKENLIAQVFPVQCKGRDIAGEEVLETPVDVTVKIYQNAGDTKSISSMVDCPFLTGGHDQRCKASHPSQDKLWEGDVVEGVTCPYSFDIPYALESKTEE